MDASQNFSVTYSVPINIERLPADYSLPTAAQLETEIPAPFRSANEVALLDVSALRPLRGLMDSAPELAEFLNLQSRKIAMIMGYVLAQQDDPQSRHLTHSIGASQLSYISPQPLPLGERLRLKIFLTDEATAVYCYGEVVEVGDDHDDSRVDDGFRITGRYRCLREQDQDALVRASLHIQTKQLKRRSAQRNNHTS